MNLLKTLTFAKGLISQAYFGFKAESLGFNTFFPHLPGITGAGIEVRGDPAERLPDDLILTVYLEREIPGLPQNLRTEFPAMFPDIEVGWRVTGNFRPLGSVAAPPLAAIAPGMAIRLNRAPFTAGTLGAVIRPDANPSERFIVSCNHILAMNDLNIGQDADNQIVRGSQAIDAGGANPVGIVESLPPICELKFFEKNSGDYAVAKAVGSGVRHMTPPGMPPLASGKPLDRTRYLAEKSHLKLLKAGAATGVTEGLLTARNAEFSMFYADLNLHVTFNHQYLVRGTRPDGVFAQPGDSGALVVTEDGHAMGLVFAGENDSTVVCPLRPLFDALHCSFALT